MNNRIIYSLNTDDVQSVALEETGRKLTSKEIDLIADLIAEKIKWYDTIAEAINDKIGTATE